MSGTRDPGKIRLCAAAPGDPQPETVELIETLLAYAITAPRWVKDQAQAWLKEHRT